MRALAILTLVVSALAPSISIGVPAFPGAEGFGTETPGGRGGDVYIVDDLGDDKLNPQEGTLRHAINTAAVCPRPGFTAPPCPRTIVFSKGGTIELQDSLVINAPFLTIAGQSAPGGGIQIRHDPNGIYGLQHGYSADSFPSIVINTDDVVIRYLRIRPGPLTPNRDCFDAEGLLPVPNNVPPVHGGTCVCAGDIRAIETKPGSERIVLDHLSLAWAADDTLAIVGTKDMTVQNTMISEGIDWVLYEGYHLPTSHPLYQAYKSCNVAATFGAQGTLTGDTSYPGVHQYITGRLSLHHNYYAHDSARTPALGNHCTTYNPADPSECITDSINNVTYNWRNFGTNLNNVLGHHFSNVIGNLYKAGPHSNLGLSMNDWDIYTPTPNRPFGLLTYLSGNEYIVDDDPIQFDVMPLDCIHHTASGVEPCENPGIYEASSKFNSPEVATGALGSSIYTAVLADVGASKHIDASGNLVANRDSVDARVIAEFGSGTGSILECEQPTPGYSPPYLHPLDPEGQPILDVVTIPECMDQFQARVGLDPAQGIETVDEDEDGMADAWEAFPSVCLDPTTPDDHLDADGDVYTNLEEYLNDEPVSPDSDGDGVADACDPRVLFTSTGTQSYPGGLNNAKDEDVVAYDVTSQTFSLYFDGSNVGIGTLTIDGFTRLPNGDLLFSFADGVINIPGLIGGPNGIAVDDSDIVRFVPTGLGAATAGTWHFYFDASAYGLNGNNEDVDAIALDAEGDLLISLMGYTAGTANGITGVKNEDLIEFSASSGTFSFYFDGSDVGLETTSTSDSEGIDGVFVGSDGQLYLSTQGNFSVPTLTGNDKDMLQFTPSGLGANTTGAYSIFLRAVAPAGIGIPPGADVRGLFIEGF